MINKKNKIKKIVKLMIKYSSEIMTNNIDKAIESGAIDIDGWDENHEKMIIPKIITIAIMEREAKSYSARGTCFEKKVKKEVINLKKFI